LLAGVPAVGGGAGNPVNADPQSAAPDVVRPRAFPGRLETPDRKRHGQAANVGYASNRKQSMNDSRLTGSVDRRLGRCPAAKCLKSVEGEKVQCHLAAAPLNPM
jgi:hypothetical protein